MAAKPSPDGAFEAIRSGGGRGPAVVRCTLRFRTLAYSASAKLRTGVDRGAQAPPG